MRHIGGAPARHAQHARRAGAHRAGSSAATKVATALALTAALGLGTVAVSTSSFADSGNPTPAPSTSASSPSPSDSASAAPTSTATSTPSAKPSAAASNTPSRKPATPPIGKKVGVKKAAAKKKAAKKAALPALPRHIKGKMVPKAPSHVLSAQRASRAGRPGSKSYSYVYARTYGYLRYGWGDKEFVCLRKMWASESNWRPLAHNRRSGAHGIPQALPGRKMASEGRDWKTNAETQIRWGLTYIKRGYGSPCRAVQVRNVRGWY